MRCLINTILTKTVLVGFVVALTTAVMFLPSPLVSHEAVNTTVTFDREIVRILNHKCIACHSERNLGVPFTTYEQTRPWARSIEEEVLRRHMPPWRAVRGYGQFANDLALTNRELQFIVAWVEGNGPKTKDQRLIVNVDQGNTPDAERLKPDFRTWQVGKPDLLKTVDPYLVSPGQEDGVRHVTIDLGLRSESWIKALEYKPADRRVVRAVFFSLQETGQWIGSWTPWYGMTTLPSSVAYRVPAGSHVVAEIHYRSANEPVEDNGTLGIFWAPGPTRNNPTDLVLEAKSSGTLSAPGQRYFASAKIPDSVRVLAFKPDLPPGVESVEVSAKMPDGTVQVLLLLRDVLPQWPTPYVLKDPVTLPKNSEITLTAYYKASAGSQVPATIKLTASVF